jgi:hypothetical protein
MERLYSCSIHQSEGSRDAGASRLMERLTAAGIAWTEHTSDWHDSERMVPCPERPEGWEIGFDASAVLTISVPANHLDQARAIRNELGLS